VTCPAGVVAAMRPVKAGGQIAAFGAACAGCPLASACRCRASAKPRSTTAPPGATQLPEVTFG